MTTNDFLNLLDELKGDLTGHEDNDYFKHYPLGRDASHEILSKYSDVLNGLIEEGILSKCPKTADVNLMCLILNKEKYKELSSS